METETASFHGLSAWGGVAWVRLTRNGTEVYTGEDKRDQDQYQANLGLSYRQGTWAADLLGHFVWWDLGPGSDEGNHDDWLWDLAASKGFATPWGTTTELFGTVRNLFNGDQNFDTSRGTEPRWVEGGVRLRF